MERDSFSVDNQLLAVLERRCEIASYEECRTLFQQGEEPRGVFVIRSGQVALLMLSPTGRVIASFKAGTGSVLGVPATVGNSPYTLTAIVRKGSAIGFIGCEEFHNLLQEEPSLYPYVLALLSSEVRAGRTALSDLVGRRPVNDDRLRTSVAVAV